MVAKISIGSSLYGAISYNGEKINEAKGRILGSNKVVIPPDGHVDVARMVEDFKSFMPKMGRTKKPVLHISLNPHPEDRLTDQDFEILAREYLDKLGFGEQPWVMYKHEDIDRHHIHIVTVNVNEQGKRLNQAFLFRRSKKITSELEDKYNLHKAQRERVSPDTPITKLDPTGDIKRQLANIVKLVGMRWQFQTLGEYNAILSLYNIRCETTDGKVNGRKYHGLVYFATNDAGETIANPFKASRLGKFASRAAVENKFERSATSINLKPSRRIISSVITDSSGKDDFIAKLREKGIDILIRENNDGRIYGVTFIDHNTHTVLNGSRLGREFSANVFERWFNGDGQKPQITMPNQSNVPNWTQSTSQTQSGGTASSNSSSNHQNNQASQQTSSYSTDFDQPSLPGLDLFQLGPGFDAEQEAMNREMERRKRKKKRRGPHL
ncbi:MULTISPECIES: conjugal transfer protein MobB [Bacteroidales]|uniref:conjugal transfer protein MobB n=1 Tax=Bacteroidales TaxID=171549 RepID=UPI0023F16FF1|nr:MULTISPECIES: conjugal transfer protein MobB [Bacteroidales]MCX4285504.1 relaxase/mobilization nuclease domain-containing protein [Duncaniella dubosii]